jgi:hypothetical protein
VDRRTSARRRRSWSGYRNAERPQQRPAGRHTGRLED